MYIKKTIVPQEVECFDNNNTSLGMHNQYEFYDFRIFIAKHQLEGYYCTFQGRKLYIDHFGGVEEWPEGFFDVMDEQLTQLLDFALKNNRI